jgi:hypothetical protein
MRDHPQIFANPDDTLVRPGRITETSDVVSAGIVAQTRDPKIQDKLEALTRR